MRVYTNYLVISIIPAFIHLHQLSHNDEYDTSKRNNKDDIDSIEKCQDSDKDYFSYYIKGEKFKFDKYIDEKNSVIYYNL